VARLERRNHGLRLALSLVLVLAAGLGFLGFTGQGKKIDRLEVKSLVVREGYGFGEIEIRPSEIVMKDEKARRRMILRTSGMTFFDRKGRVVRELPASSGAPAEKE